MLALLFILFITAIGVLTSVNLSQEVTWFTYYIGGIIGLFVSSAVLHFWNKKKGKKDSVDQTKGSPI